MFRLRTRCGREVTLTGDHNLWVLRGGRLKLLRTLLGDAVHRCHVDTLYAAGSDQQAVYRNA